MLKSIRAVRRIVILTQKEIGDLIVMTPLIRALKGNYVIVASRPVAREVYAGNPHIAENVDIEVTKVKKGWIFSRAKYFFRVLFLLRRLKPDVVLQMESNDILALWSFFSGAHIRISTRNQTFRKLFTALNPLTEGEQSALVFYMRFLDSLNLPPLGENTELFAHRPDRTTRSRKRVLVHPGARIPEKLWPLANWVELLPLLIAKFPQIDFVIVDSAFDREVCTRLREALPKANWVAVQSFADLCTAASNADLMITLDSSPRHVAAAYDVPTLAILPEWTLNDWGIYDRERHRVVTSKAIRPAFGLDTISVAQVELSFAEAVKLF